MANTLPQSKGRMNPVLKKIMDDLSAKVSEQNKDAYKKTVLAGSRIIFDPKTHANLELVKNPESRKTPTQTIAKGIGNLMWLMFLQSKKMMGFEPMIMGGLTLMCEVIDFAERGLKIPFDQDMIAETSKLAVEAMFEKMGITPEDLEEAIKKGGAEIDEYHKTGMIPANPVFTQALRPQQAQQTGQAQQPEPQAQPPKGALG
jgi:hypothetical protein